MNASQVVLLEKEFKAGLSSRNLSVSLTRIDRCNKDFESTEKEESSKKDVGRSIGGTGCCDRDRAPAAVSLPLHWVLLLGIHLTVQLCWRWISSTLTNNLKDGILCCLTPEESVIHHLYFKKQDTTLSPCTCKCVILKMLCLSYTILQPKHKDIR